MLYATTNISYSIFIGNDSNLVITSNTWSKWVKGIEYEEMWVYRVDDDLLQGKFILNSVYRMKLMMNIDRKENWSKMQFLIEARRSFHLCHCSAHVDCARATTISRKEKRTQYSLSRSHTKIMHKTTFDTYTRALSSDFFLSLSLSFISDWKHMNGYLFDYTIITSSSLNSIVLQLDCHPGVCVFLSFVNWSSISTISFSRGKFLSKNDQLWMFSRAVR